METKRFVFKNETIVNTYKFSPSFHLSTHEIEKSLENIWEWAISQLRLLEKQFNEDGYVCYIVSKALDWYRVKGMSMKNNLIGKLKSKPNQNAVSNFLLSIELLKKRGYHKLNHLSTCEEKEHMIEWILELPYMLKTRLERQGLLMEKKDYMPSKYEYNEKRKIEVKQETLTGVSLIFVKEGDFYVYAL